MTAAAYRLSRPQLLITFIPFTYSRRVFHDVNLTLLCPIQSMDIPARSEVFRQYSLVSFGKRGNDEASIPLWLECP